MHLVDQFRSSSQSDLAVAAVVIALLAVDSIGPVPSSLVGAFAGLRLGVATGSVVVWVGLMASCVVGYALADRLAHRSIRHADRLLGTAATLTYRRRLLLLLAATRPIPLLAEASIITAGATRLPRVPFLTTCAVANVPVAVAFSALPDAFR